MQQDKPTSFADTIIHKTRRESRQTVETLNKPGNRLGLKALPIFSPTCATTRLKPAHTGCKLYCRYMGSRRQLCLSEAKSAELGYITPSSGASTSNTAQNSSSPFLTAYTLPSWPQPCPSHQEQASNRRWTSPSLPGKVWKFKMNENKIHSQSPSASEHACGAHSSLLFFALRTAFFAASRLSFNSFQLVTEEFLSAKQKVKAESTTTYH